MSREFLILTTYLKRISIAIFLYTLCRVLFFLFNINFFSSPNFSIFFFGILFDLSAIAWIYIPFTVINLTPLSIKYPRFTKYLFHISTFLSVSLNVIDFEYFKFTLKRSTFDLFELILIGNDALMQSKTLFLGYWYLLLIIIILTLVSEYLYRKTEIKLEITSKSILRLIIVFTTLLTLNILASRGGLGLRPISIIHASNYTSSNYVPPILNTPFTVIHTALKQNIEQKTYIPDDSLQYYTNSIKKYNFTSDSIFTRPNIVLIILESFSNEYIGALNNDKTLKSYTPFLDSLIDKSIAFNNCYANSKKSIEGIPSILAGLPAIMYNPYISSGYSANALTSLPKCLKEIGYSTQFFHGGINGTMGFDAFASSIEFDYYFGKNEYPNEEDFDGNWGIYDEPYLNYFCDKLSDFQEPFFSTIFTLSSHHPFSIPEKYEGVFDEGNLPIHKTIQYADLSLKKFFDKAKKQSWYTNTTFIITSDHTSQLQSKKYQTAKGIYAIPLIIFSSQNTEKQIKNTITQQIDILPTTLFTVKYPYSFYSMGNNILEDNTDGFSVSFLGGIYQIITEKCILQYDGQQTIAIYDFQKDSLLKNNLKLDSDLKTHYLKKDIEFAEKKLKAIIQEYNLRMINNTLEIRK